LKEKTGELYLPDLLGKQDSGQYEDWKDGGNAAHELIIEIG
jgi:hypothetical protein